MKLKNLLFWTMNYKLPVFTILFLIATSTLYSQTTIGIAPGESVQINREHTISILPITNVTISILGEDSLYVAGTVDSFRIVTGTLNIKTYYTLFVPLTAPIRELSIRVLLAYNADNVLTQKVYEDYIINTDVLPSIIANFTADIIEGPAPLTVNFTSESTGNIIGYFWDFGDEITSSEQNPLHTYLEPGTYSVSLIVFNFSVQHQKIKQDYINVLEATSVKTDMAIKPAEFYLSQNYPNPFNPITTINYLLANKSNVILSVFDLTGRVVKILVNQVQNAGLYSVTFDASNLNSGIYFYKIKTEAFEQSRQMILLR
jgi:hypothetical protein